MRVGTRAERSSLIYDDADAPGRQQRAGEGHRALNTDSKVRAGYCPVSDWPARLARYMA